MEKKQKIKQEDMHQSMRGYFAGSLYNEMIDNDKIWLVVGDLGYGVFDKIRDAFPERFLNTGASEQAAAGICVGLALENCIPFFYSITTFLLYRPFETIKLYVDHENIKILLVGSGRDTDYHIDGPSHDATDARKILDLWPNIKQYWPLTTEEIPELVKQMVKLNKPQFISLKR